MTIKTKFDTKETSFIGRLFLHYYKLKELLLKII